MGAIRPAAANVFGRAALSALGVALVAALDFVSGVEIRVYPLYYIPIAFAAWYLGRRWTVAIAALSTLAWIASNFYAGMHYSAPAIWAFNACMHLVSFLVVGLLLAQLKTALSHERALSRTDPLTALLNVRAFHEEARRVLSEARRKGRPVTVAYLDLDDFKAINERLGHHGGDETLRRVATAIRRSTRLSDLAARVGGDEFVLVFPETGLDAARVALDRLRAALAQTVGETGPFVTASIGAVVFTEIPESVEEMVRVADQWMYRAKAAGKDRVLLEAGVPAPPAVSAAGG